MPFISPVALARCLSSLGHDLIYKLGIKFISERIKEYRFAQKAQAVASGSSKYSLNSSFYFVVSSGTKPSEIAY